MRIDVHNHFMPQKFARILEKRRRYPFTRLEGATYQFYCCKGLAMPMTAPVSDMAVKLADMDSVGIDVAILSLGVPGPELVGGSKGDELARIANDTLAEIIAAHPNRFWGFTSLGFGDMEASLKELDRCFNELKFRGLQIFSNIKGKPLDALEWRPLFRRMAELRRPIFIHPTVPLNTNYLMDLVPVPALGFLVDTTLAAMRLALAGVLEEFSALPIIIPHVGGMVPYLMPRLDCVMAMLPRPGVIRDPSRLLKQLYMDTVVYGAEPLKWCLETMGAERLLFGSDHPYVDWRRPVTIMDSLQCSDEDREKILHGNAERIFAV
jgi:aminocarboxymuconate-semialdehyde decarboxylase